MSSSSSNAKTSGLKTSNNTKTIMKDTNIYPGFNHNKIQNELSSLTFVKVFPDIQRWITSKNLEHFIKDPHGDKIPFISTSELTNATLQENFTRQTYNSQKQQKLQIFTDNFRSNWKDEIYTIHTRLHVRFPPETIALIPTRDFKNLARAYNRLPATQGYPLEEIEFSDPRIKSMILEKFNDTYQHWSEFPLAPPLTLEVIRERLELVGKLQDLEKDIETEKSKLLRKESDQADNIRLMKEFFTNIITNYPAEITPFVENRNFTSAWNKILIYNLETIDTGNIHLDLQKSILNLEFNPHLDTNFYGYYERHVTTHALFLFKRYHTFFSYDECRTIVDTMTDADFTITHATIIANNNLVLPDICRESHRIQILKAAFKGTHLHDNLQIFDQINELSTQTVEALKTSLATKDNSTEIKYSKSKSSNTQSSSSDNCIICTYIKMSLGFSNVSTHPGTEACPDKNLEVLKTYFAKHPVTRSTTSGSGKGSNPNPPRGNNSNPRGANDSSTKLELPIGFDEDTHCCHCWRSGQVNGKDSQERLAIHAQHSSRNCDFNRLKKQRYMNSGTPSSNSGQSGRTPYPAHPTSTYFGQSAQQDQYPLVHQQYHNNNNQPSNWNSQYHGNQAGSNSNLQQHDSRDDPDRNSNNNRNNDPPWDRGQRRRDRDHSNHDDNRSRDSKVSRSRSRDRGNQRDDRDDTD